MPPPSDDVHVEPNPTRDDALPDGRKEWIFDTLRSICGSMAVDIPDVRDFYCKVNGGGWTWVHRKKGSGQLPRSGERKDSHRLG